MPTAVYFHQQVSVCFGINTVLFNTTDVHSCVFPWQVFVCFGINTVLFNTTDVHSCVFPWQVPVCFWTNSTLPLLIWTCLIEAHHQRGCAFKGCWLPLTRSSSLLMEWTASFSLDRTAVSLFTPLLVGRFAETSNKFLLFGWNAPGLSNNFGADHDSNCLASLSWNLFSLLKIDAWKPW